MKNVGEFCGLKIWVPDTGDVIADQQSFDILKSHLEQMFPMVALPAPKLNAGKSCRSCARDTDGTCGEVYCNDLSNYVPKKEG